MLLSILNVVFHLDHVLVLDVYKEVLVVQGQNEFAVADPANLR